MALFRKPNSGEGLREYLEALTSEAEVVWRVHGDGVVTSPDGDVSITSEGGAGEEVVTYFAKIEKSKYMRVPAMVYDPVFKTLQRTSGTELHSYRFVYEFTEVNLLQFCFGADGGELHGLKCGKQNHKYVTTRTGGRKGSLDWPEDGSKDSTKWAINLSEVLHKKDTWVGTSDPNYVYGVNVKANIYPSNYLPMGIGQAPDDPPVFDAYEQVVEMHETTGADGNMIRWFDNPGVHMGDCFA